MLKWLVHLLLVLVASGIGSWIDITYGSSLAGVLFPVLTFLTLVMGDGLRKKV